MAKIMLDACVLLDYFGAGCSEEDHRAAVDLVTELWRAGEGFLVTPTTVKDFAYLLGVLLKRDMRAQKGEVTVKGSAAIQRVCEAALAHVPDVGTVVSIGLVDCEMARSLCKAHADFEDNLIAAAALRIGADCIITRDDAFMRRCPVACMGPAAALAALRAGAFARAKAV